MLTARAWMSQDLDTWPEPAAVDAIGRRQWRQEEIGVLAAARYFGLGARGVAAAGPWRAVNSVSSRTPVLSL